jgi:hypothetical protein
MIADDPHAARRYVIAVALIVAALVASLPALNVVIDPLGYARAAGWRPAHPTPLELAFASSGAWPVPHGTREAKVLNVRYYAPESVYFGSSTVWSYIDSGYAPLRTADGRRAYNFGMAGATAEELLMAFEHVVALKVPVRVVVGMEFYMFGADKPASPGFFDLPFAQHPTYRWDLLRFVGRRLLSSDYTYQSATMIWKPIDERLSAWFRPAAHPAAAPSAPGAPMSRAQFSRLMIDADKIMVTALYPNLGGSFRLVDDTGRSTLETIRRMVSIARAKNIDLRLYISPNHARSYEAIRLLGWWPQFEAWQRGLVAIVDEDARAHPGQPPVPLWDFCCYNTLTTDVVVQPPGQAAGFQYFADSIHFKTVVGFMLIDRIFSTEASRALPADFGVRLDADSIEAHLADTRNRQTRYTATHPADVGSVVAALTALGRSMPAAR